MAGQWFETISDAKHETSETCLLLHQCSLNIARDKHKRMTSGYKLPSKNLDAGILPHQVEPCWNSVFSASSSDLGLEYVELATVVVVVVVVLGVEGVVVAEVAVGDMVVALALVAEVVAHAVLHSSDLNEGVVAVVVMAKAAQVSHGGPF